MQSSASPSKFPSPTTPKVSPPNNQSGKVNTNVKNAMQSSASSPKVPSPTTPAPKVSPPNNQPGKVSPAKVPTPVVSQAKVSPAKVPTPVSPAKVPTPVSPAKVSPAKVPTPVVSPAKVPTPVVSPAKVATPVVSPAKVSPAKVTTPVVSPPKPLAVTANKTLNADVKKAMESSPKSVTSTISSTNIKPENCKFRMNDAVKIKLQGAYFGQIGKLIKLNECKDAKNEQSNRYLVKIGTTDIEFKQSDLELSTSKALSSAPSTPKLSRFDLENIDIKKGTPSSKFQVKLNAAKASLLTKEYHLNVVQDVFYDHEDLMNAVNTQMKKYNISKSPAGFNKDMKTGKHEINKSYLQGNIFIMSGGEKKYRLKKV
jgi:hypothetical protein